MEDLAVVARGWMAVRQEPAAGMVTMDVPTLPGVDPAMETSADADHPGPVDSAEDRGMHQERPAVATAVKVTDVKETAVLKNAVPTTAVRRTVASKIGVLTIAALATNVSRVVVRRTVALKIVVPAPVRVLVQEFVPAHVASVMAMPAACVRDVLTAMSVRSRSNPEATRRPMEPTLLRMI